MANMQWTQRTGTHPSFLAGYRDAIQCHRLNSSSVLSAIMADVEYSKRVVAGEPGRQYAAGLEAGIQRCMRHQRAMRMNAAHTPRPQHGFRNAGMYERQPDGTDKYLGRAREEW